MKANAAWKGGFFGEVLPNIVQGTVYCVVTCRAEDLQWLVRQDASTYTWATGHVSCFGVAAWWTAWLLALNALADMANLHFGLKPHARPMRTLIYLLVPALLTFHEFVPFFSQTESVFDWQDILCYLAGTLAVFAVAAPLRRYGVARSPERG